jgi:hypothetical protein
MSAPEVDQGFYQAELSYEREMFLSAYMRLGSMREACAECGVKPFYGYMWLKKTGNMSIGDKCAYGSASSRLGGAAELEFQRLVPNAVPSNSVIARNNESFDFTVDGVTIDVKYSGLRASGKWGFQTARRKRRKPEFYAAFFATDPGGKLEDGYRLFLIPHDMIAGHGSVTMRRDNTTHFLIDYEVSPDRVAEMIEEYGCA